jgi:hypothetical protein
VTVKSYDELKTILDEHYHGTKDVEEAEEVVVTKTSAPTPSVQVVAKKTVKPVEEEDDSIKELLKGL